MFGGGSGHIEAPSPGDALPDDASGETVILVGLAPGQHHVLFELADPTHKVVAREIIKFTVPAPTGTDRPIAAKPGHGG